MNKKTIQYFTAEYLSRCQGTTSDQIIEFLENYRMLFSIIPEKELKNSDIWQKRSVEPTPHLLPESYPI